MMQAGVETAISQQDGSAEAVYFQSGTNKLFGWLHLPPQGHVPRAAVVLCNPFGYEAICAHRSLREFARRFAAAGMVVLRFDYAGTGNSQDIDPQADQIALWTADLTCAAAFLRQRTGVGHVVLAGFRLGALLAVRAAAQSDPALSVIAIAPIVSGKRYLRELRTIQMAAGGAPAAAEAGAMEVSGFTLSAASVAMLGTLDIAKPLPALRDVLIVDRKELPAMRPWSDALTEAGARVRYAVLPGFVRMMMTAPHFAAVPEEMIAAARDWLCELAPASGAGASSRGVTLPSAFMACSDEGVAGEALNETAMLVTSAPQLFAVVSEPPQGERRRRGVILLNAGGTHHVGPNRMYVRLARRWAGNGYVVMRLDLAGLGDSETREGQAPGEVYPPDALQDIGAALQCLRTNFGVCDVTLVGLCSGAYHALRAAAAVLPIRRVIMINPANFRWNSSMTLHGLTWLGFIHNPRSYLQQVLPSRPWKKIVTGKVNVGRLIKLFAQHAWVGAGATVRNLLRTLHLPVHGDIGQELRAIAARGTDMVFVFATGDPGIELLKHETGKTPHRLGVRCRTQFIDGADHVFSQGLPRLELESVLSEALFAHHGYAEPAPSTSLQTCVPGG